MTTIKRQLSQGPITHLEQHVVKRLAPLVPDVLTPNSITVSSSIAGILTGVSFVLSIQWKWMLFVTSVLIFLHWFFDALDGAVARYRKTSSKTGFYLDHMLDGVTACALLTGMYISDATQTAFPLILALLYLLLEINVLVGAILFGTFNISVTIFGPAEAQFLFIVVNTLAYFQPDLFGLPVWDVVSLAAVVFLLPAFATVFTHMVKRAITVDRGT